MGVGLVLGGTCVALGLMESYGREATSSLINFRTPSRVGSTGSKLVKLWPNANLSTNGSRLSATSSHPIG